MAHSCRPKQPNRAGRSAVRTSSSRTKRNVSPRALLRGLDVDADDVPVDR